MSGPCVTVGFTGTPGDGGHIQRSSIYTFTWLPKGYAPTAEDRMVAVVFAGDIESGLGEEDRHPLIDAVAKAIEDYMRKNPGQAVGFLENARR